MTLEVIGLVISGILFFLSGGLFIYGSYVSYEKFNNVQTETRPAKLLIKYHQSGAIGIGLATFTLLSLTIGFTWESLVFSVVMGVATLGFGVLDNFIRFKTITYLHKRGQNTSISSLLSELHNKIDENKKVE